VTTQSLDDNLNTIWQSKHPGETFEYFCTAYLGEICQHECMLLSAIFDEASRPGVEAYAGLPSQFTADWELDENAYMGSTMGLVVNKELRGAQWVPGIRALKEDQGKLQAPTTRRLQYRMWAADCMRCLVHDVCTPECLEAETPCGSEAIAKP